MSEAIPRDFYAEKLVEVNESNAVIATEGIYNEQGALIVAKGMPICKETARRIALHKLPKPLDQSISLERIITSQSFIERLRAMPTHPELIRIFKNERANKWLQEEADNLSKYPLLVQKLTVMKECMPDCYEDSSFGAVISLQICEGLDLSDKDRHAIFLGALARDIGLLHIDPDVAVKEHGFTAAEWRLYEGHIAIGFKLLGLAKAPKLARLALLEHHERADGFGFPRGRSWPELTLAGQVVAFSNMTIALIDKYVLKMGCSMRALQTIFQVNANQHTREVAAAALLKLDQIAGPRINLYGTDSLPKLTSQLCRAHPLIKLLIAQIDEFWHLLEELPEDLDLTPIANALHDLRRVVVSSGITDPMLLQWINGLEADSIEDGDMLELENYALMLEECTWKFGELFRSIITSPERDRVEASTIAFLRVHYRNIKKTFDLLVKVRDA